MVMCMNWLKLTSILILSTSVAMGAPKKMLLLSLVLGLIAFVLDKDRLIYIRENCFYKTFFNIIILIGSLVIYAKYSNNENGFRFIVKYFDVLIPLVIVWIFIGRLPEFIKYSLIGFGIGNIINSLCATSNWLEEGGRVGGYFGGPNDLGGILLVVTPFFLYGIFECKNRFLSLFFVLNIALVVWCLHISNCRGAIIGVGYESILFVTIRYYLLKMKTIKLLYGLVSTLIMIVLPIAVVLCFSRSYDLERVLLWIAGYKMFIDNILFGVGLTNFNEYYNAFYISPLAKEPYLQHPHNSILFILAETGLFGFVMFMNLILDIIKRAIKYIKVNDLKKREMSIACIFLLALFGIAVHAQVDCTPLWRPVRTAMVFSWTMVCVQIANYRLYK